MFTIRPAKLETDYQTLVKWWEAHKALPMPEYVFPQGWVVSGGGVDIAMAFLYLDVGGKFAVIEWLTTNPSVAYSKSLVNGVRALIDHIETQAKVKGCAFIISFVAPGTGEERLLSKVGYSTSAGPSHRLYAKPLTT